MGPVGIGGIFECGSPDPLEVLHGKVECAAGGERYVPPPMFPVHGVQASSTPWLVALVHHALSNVLLPPPFPCAHPRLRSSSGTLPS